MKHKAKIQSRIFPENHIKDSETQLLKIKKKEKFISIGIYVLIVLMTMALMIILLNIIEF